MIELNAFLTGVLWLIPLSIVLGIILVIIEIIMPNFGIIGGVGIVLLLVGIGGISQIVDLPVLVGIIALVLVIIVGALIFVYRSSSRGGIGKFLVLKTVEGKDKGYVGVNERKEIIGKEGIALTQLRPAGTAEFDGERLDVVTEGDFISKGTKVKVVEVKGYRIIVSKIVEKE